MKTVAAKFLLTIVVWLSPAKILADDLVVVVNEANTTIAMSKAQVIDLFMGRYVAFPNGDKAAPVDSNDEFRALFYQQLIGMSLARVNAYWSRIKFTGRVRPPLMKSTTEDVVDFIEATSNSIGYLPASEVTDGMRVIYRLQNDN
ncbi:MAG: hypothetical protein HWE27_13855 [Gammaproteobacteria bacterium]|nr:hypothetical protein [Gammaproteobacteria bacterium]